MPSAQLQWRVAMDLNGTGTLVDVTSRVRGVEGISKTATRQDQFRDAAAATFTFTLENYDGYVTPGNTVGYSNPPTERMTVNWSLSNGTQTRYFAGSILTMTPTDDNWNLLTVTCDDMLGAASRNTLGNLAYGAAIGSAPYLYWPLNDAPTSAHAAEVTGNGFPLTLIQDGGTTTFGSTGFPAINSETQLLVAGKLTSATTTNPISVITGAAGSLGYVGCWITTQGVLAGTVSILVGGIGGGGWNFGLAINNGTQSVYAYRGFAGGSSTSSFTLTAGIPTYCAAGLTYTYAGGLYSYSLTLYVNGAVVATATPAATATFPTDFHVNGFLPTSTPEGLYLAHFSYSPTLVREDAAGITTEANRLTLLDQTTAQVTLATLPTDLSTAPVGYAATSGKSTLDAFNEVIRTEQGYIDCATTGTLTAPVQTVRVRARNRPAAVTYSFDAQLELAAILPFIRDSTNLIWSDTVTGANSSSQVVSQAALQARAGSNNASDTVLTYVPSDLYEYGSDRLWRGANIALRPQSVQINNLTCPTDRSADLLAMVPGDRIEITNIPNTVLGFTTWDGWLLDLDESHTSGPGAQNLFTLYLQPCQPATMIWDTDLWANGGNNLLTTAMTTGTTSAIVGSADAVTWFEQVAMNYYIQIDSEVMKVTAAGAPSGGNQTLTVARAQLGTSAATHAIGALPEIYADSTARLNNAIWAF